jgi:hypothetical protein
MTFYQLPSHARLTHKKMIKSVLFILVLSTVACVKKEESPSLSFEKISTILLEEPPDIKIGRIAVASLASDTSFFVLDISSKKVIHYAKTGEVLSVILTKGKSPNEIDNPFGMCLDKDNLYVTEDGVCIKKFTQDGKFIKQIFISDDNLIPSQGVITTIAENNLLINSLFESLEHPKIPLFIMDTSGVVVERIGAYPDVYQNYWLLAKCDYALSANKKVLVCFYQSDDLYYYDFREKSGHFIKPRTQSNRYISSKRKKRSESIEELIKLSRIEAGNIGIYHVNDSIAVRTFDIQNEVSQQKQSFVLRDNYIQFLYLQKDNTFIESTPQKIGGVIRAKLGDVYIVEESDEPDKRQFGLYKIVFPNSK